MPLLIAISHQKGGVGKSTLVLALAAYFAEQGLSVGVADMDKQGTIAGLFGELEAYKEAKPKLLKNFSLEDLSPYQSLDAILIDTPPYLNKNLISIFEKVHFVLIPTQPSLADVMAIRGTIGIFKEALPKNAGLKCGVVMTMLAPNSNQDAIRAHIEGLGVKVTQTTIAKRVSFVRALAYPRNVFVSSDKKAIAEVESLAAEIIELIKST
jgi:chromosome partitioning protein